MGTQDVFIDDDIEAEGLSNRWSQPGNGDSVILGFELQQTDVRA